MQCMPCVPRPLPSPRRRLGTCARTSPRRRFGALGPMGAVVAATFRDLDDRSVSDGWGSDAACCLRSSAPEWTFSYATRRRTGSCLETNQLLRWIGDTHTTRLRYEFALPRFGPWCTSLPMHASHWQAKPPACSGMRSLALHTTHLKRVRGINASCVGPSLTFASDQCFGAVARRPATARSTAITMHVDDGRLSLHDMRT
jgi:hypothetical protein